MNFRKTYDDLHAICVVDYAGMLESDGMQITGEWVRLSDIASGIFAMQRDKRRAASAKQQLKTRFH